MEVVCFLSKCQQLEYAIHSDDAKLVGNIIINMILPCSSQYLVT